jgi:hypothetical protein
VAEAICRDAELACSVRDWLTCEPITLFRDTNDGHLRGESGFAREADAGVGPTTRPDGICEDLINILCDLSRTHAVDWELRHDGDPAFLGIIRAGVCPRDVRNELDMYESIPEHFEEEFQRIVEVGSTFTRMPSRDYEEIVEECRRTKSLGPITLGTSQVRVAFQFGIPDGQWGEITAAGNAPILVYRDLELHFDDTGRLRGI